MGEVYEARDTHLNHTVAIKVLRAERMADVGRKVRFVQEAQAASLLNHPNIVVIHERQGMRLLTRCLRKDPERRFQQMAEVKLALEDLKEEWDRFTG